MANVKMKVQGLKELEKNLLALNKEYGGKSAPSAMRPAIKAAMSPLLSQVQSETPVDTGRLRDSAKLAIGVPSKKMVSQSQHFKSSTIIAGRVGWFWKSGNSLWKQGLAVEFGTANQKANYTLTQLLERNNSQMISTFKNSLGPAIEKKAASLHKKKLKGK